MTEQRKLAAVMFTDIVGYTALMSRDEQKALALLQRNRGLQKSLAERHNGEFLKEMGDGTLLCFQSALDAVRCAMEIQESVKDDPDLNLRIGIHLGDIVFKEGDVFGDGVNVASRIEHLAEAGSICISEEVYRSVRNQQDIDAVFLDEKQLKNVDHPVKIYALAGEGVSAFQSKALIPEGGDSKEKSIIVLPFENVSPDPGQEYFSDGLTEEIITDLSHIHELLVISRSSAMTFKGTKKTIPEIVNQVNVRYVLEGSVRKAGNNLRITAQLIDATTDAHLWADKYMGTLDDVFDIQEKVSRAIVDALKVKLIKKESNQIAERPIDNLQAYELYLKARQEIWKWTEDGLERALQYLRNGLNIIGDNSLFYFGIGYVYWTRINIGFQSKEDCLVNAERYAKRILQMDPDSPYGHHLIGLIHLRAANLQLGVIHLKQALEANPNDPDALHWLCIGYLNAGKTNAAGPLIDRLLKIDPLTPTNYYIPGWFQMIEGQFESALHTLHKAYRMEPKNPIHRFCYAVALAYNEQLEEAYSLFDAHINDSPEHLWAQMGQCLKYALLREKEKVTELMSGGLKSKARCDVFDSWVIAVCDALIDEKEEALDSLETAVNLGTLYYPFLNEYDPFLQNIRGEERFKKLMKRVKKEWENFEV